MGDDRFEVVEFEDNVGVYRHFERLLQCLPDDTKWVSLADQDDYWYADKFSRLLTVLDRPGVTAVLGQARLVNERGEILGQTDRRPGGLVDTILRNQLAGSLALIRSEVLRDAFPFPAATDIAIHDHWLAVCASAQGKIALLDEVVQDYVQHQTNVIGGQRAMRVRDVLILVRRADSIRGFFDQITTQHWAWRVSMASSLLAQSSAPSGPTRRAATG